MKRGCVLTAPVLAICAHSASHPGALCHFREGGNPVPVYMRSPTLRLSWIPAFVGMTDAISLATVKSVPCEYLNGGFQKFVTKQLLRGSGDGFRGLMRP